MLDAVATSNPELINKFGGHAMAAGLSINKKVLREFSDAFDSEVVKQISQEALEKIIQSDGSVQPAEMTLETAESIRRGGPWGQHFSEPVFDGRFNILDWRIVGEKHLKLQLQQKGGSDIVDAIAFNTEVNDLPAGDQVIHASYRLDVNEFRGSRKLQLVIEHINHKS